MDLPCDVCLFSAEPKFSAPITNVTVPVGREAILACVVQDLSTYKVTFIVNINPRHVKGLVTS